MIGGLRLGKPTHVRLFNCLNMLSSRNSADRNEDMAYMEGKIWRQYVLQLSKVVEDIYGETYLRRWPTHEELDDVEKKWQKKVFPGCVGTIDYYKQFLKNCPSQDKGQYLNMKESKLESIKCEAWCDVDLYCWHRNVSCPGINNDIKVLMRSIVLKDLISGRFSFRLPR